MRAKWAEVLEEGGLPHLGEEEMNQALAKTGRSGALLLAARRLTDDPRFLQEATNQFANDPLLQQHMALIHSKTPESRRQWLDAYKGSSADNALPYYLSANEYFKQGQPEAALADLAQASGRSGWDGQVLEQIQSMEELLLAAGYSPAEAKSAASVNALMPQLAPLKSLAKEMAARQGSQAGGEDPSAWLQAGLAMSQHLEQRQGGQMIIDQLVGYSIEKILYQNWPADQPIPDLGMTPADRLAQIQQIREHIKEHAELVNTELQYSDDAEATSYFDRVKLNGELAALEWLRRRRQP